MEHDATDVDSDPPLERMVRLEASVDARNGRCALFDGEATCGLVLGHETGDDPRPHRFYDPAGGGAWVERDDFGRELARGGGATRKVPKKKGGGKGPATEYDWPSIKARYVEGVRDDKTGLTEWPTLKEVADHFGLTSMGRIYELSSIEGWSAARAKFQAQVERVRQARRAEELAKEAVGLDGKALDSAKLGLQLCFAALTDLAQRAQRARAANVGEGGGSGGVIDALEQQRLAAAVDLWHKVGLRAIGDPETHRLEITGANGRPIEIAAELRRDDPTRISTVLAVLAEAGLDDLFGGVDDARRTLADARRADGGVPQISSGS